MPVRRVCEALNPKVFVPFCPSGSPAPERPADQGGPAEAGGRAVCGRAERLGVDVGQDRRPGAPAAP